MSSYCSGALVYINNVEYRSFKTQDESELVQLIWNANRQRWPEVTLRHPFHRPVPIGECIVVNVDTALVLENKHCFGFSPVDKTKMQ